MKKSIWAAIIALFSSCEQVLLPKADRSNLAVFDALTKDVGERYSYFQEKNIDWDSLVEVKSKHIHDEMSEQEFFDSLATLLFTLRDGHVNLISDFDVSRNWDWAANYPPNFDENVLERNYLGNDFRIIGPMRCQWLGEQLYIYYGSFATELSIAHLSAMVDLAEQSEGLIIDIRNNGGGSLNRAAWLASCFTEEVLVYAKNRMKNGSGPSDFTPWQEAMIPSPKERVIQKKLAVLTNRSTYSAANAFAQMAKVLPNAQLYGDQTGGGAGIPVYGELANGWTYRFSATQSVSPEGVHLEFGVMPDVIQGMSTADVAMGIDPIIEKALEWLRE